jgi:hypothetical protein
MTRRKGGTPLGAAIVLLGELAHAVERNERTYKDLFRLSKSAGLRSPDGKIDVSKLSEVERYKFERTAIQVLNKSDLLQAHSADAEAAHLRAFECVNTEAAKKTIPDSVRRAIARACDELLRFSQVIDTAHMDWLRLGKHDQPEQIGGAE